MTLDRDLRVRTAEHVGISYELAGIGNRFLAAFVDLLVTGLIELGLILLLGFALREVEPNLRATILGVAVVLLILALPFTYWVLLESFWNGQTLGKRIVGIRVLRDDGAPVGFFAVLARGLLRILDLLPFIFPIDLVLMVVSSKGQRLGDLVAGTVVVKASLARDFAALRTTASPTVAQLTVRGLSGEEQRLVREFALREPRLASPVRERVARTIAARVRPAVPESAELADDVEFLRAVAASLREAGGDVSHRD